MTDDAAGPHRVRGPAEFLESTVATLRAAACTRGLFTTTLMVAGLTVQIDVFAPAMVRCLQALSHLRRDQIANPDLTLCVWDSATTGLPALRADWGVAEYSRYGEILGFNDERFYTGIQFEPLIFGMLDSTRRIGLCWTPSALDLPQHAFGSPMRPLLQEWLRRNARLPVHGGAVGFRHGGVLLAGPSGSGKSNAALACLNSALLYAGDDFSILSDADGWTVHSLYSSAKLLDADLLRHPQLSGLSDPARRPGEKHILSINERFPDRVVESFPLRAIVLPKVCLSETSALRPTTPGEALRAIAISTMEMAPRNAAWTFKRVADLVRTVPSFELRMGRDSDRVPDLIGALLT